MKDLKRLVGNLLFFVILIVITFGLIFKDQDMSQIETIISNVKLQYVALGILAMCLYFFCEAFNIKRILKAFGEKITMLKSIKYTLIGFFFSAITPAATGGQPVEVYYMHKDKLSTTYSITALLVQLCCFQIVTISLGIIAAIINYDILQDGIVFLFMLGITINGIALTLMLISLFSKKISRKIINLVIKILKLFKYKKLEEKKSELEKGLEKYHAGSELIKKNKLIFFRSLGVVFLQIIVYYSVPFFVYKAFGLSGYNMFEIITIQALLYSAVSGIPLPGAVGISEGVFLKIYGAIFGTALLGSATLLNRGINFYLFVVISAIVVIVNSVRVKKKEKQIEFDNKNEIV